MAMIAGAILLAGIVTIAKEPKERTDGSKKGSLGAAFWKFAVGMLESILFYSLVCSCVEFAIARRGQMKPTDPKKLPVWSGKKRVRGLCGCGWKSPPGELWLKWIGEDKGFEDLPPRPPHLLHQAGPLLRLLRLLELLLRLLRHGRRHVARAARDGRRGRRRDRRAHAGQIQVPRRLRRGRARPGRRRGSRGTGVAGTRHDARCVLAPI